MAIFRNAALALALLVGTGTAAHAEHWVQTLDTWIWIDTDSFKIEDGVTYYAQSHGNREGVPPDVGGGSELKLENAAECATGKLYIYDNEGNDPADYHWEQVKPSDYNTKYIAKTLEIVCNR